VAEPRELNQDGDSSGEPTPSTIKGWDPRAPRLLEGDRMANRASLYFLIFVILFIGAFGPVRSAWNSDPDVHELLETLSTLMAFVVGSLALVRFYSIKRGTFLFIGTGFLGTALLDAFHIIVSAGFGTGDVLSEFHDLASWSFTGSGLYLSVFLFVSWLSWWKESRGEEEEIKEGRVYLTAIFLAALIFVGLNVFPLGTAFYPEGSLRHPAEFAPAFFFLMTLAGYLAKGHWRFDAFEHFLAMSLIIAVMAHGAYMPFSAEFYDADFDASHLLKLLSYSCVLIGLLASVFITFRREEEAAEATRSANSALAREIDVRRQAERILQGSEDRLQDFLDNAHDLIQSVGPEGEFLYVNRAWKEALGYTEEDLEELNFYDILQPNSRERLVRQFASVFDGESLPSIEVEFATASGELVRCNGNANPFFQDGKAVATRSIFRDTTDSYEARRELEAFQANLQALVENTGDAIWSVNRSLALITFNTAFSMGLEARTGREPIGKDLPEDSFPADDAVWYRERYQRALKGEAFSELRDDEIGGQLRSYELFFNPIREAMGITGVAVFSKDVTARRRTQVALRMAKEEAERANMAKSQFLANMSHELRTPLNSVIGFTNILLKNRSGHLIQQELGFLDRISANGRHLLDLINEVLDLAKIEAGRMELDLRPTALEPLLKETLAQMEGQLKGKSLALTAEVPEGLPELELDAGKLKQVIINLVGNALKFTEEGGITVRVIPTPDGKGVARIRVLDTGIGIPPDRLQAIFEAFQQADGTTSRRFGGTGLGLTISRSLCQLMGFDLEVESEVDKGSSFTILMTGLDETEKAASEELMQEALKPIESSKPREGTKVAPPEEAAPRGPHRILIIDDDPDARILMTHFLEDLGCEIATAASAGEGLKMARQSAPDLVTLDLMMPGVTGWEALREFKKDPALRDIPVVIVSMLAGEGDRSNLLGAVDLLTKPVDKDDLLRVLQRNLEGRGGRTILVVDDDEDTRAVIRNYLEEGGLTVITAANGVEAEERLGETKPDAILLDLVMPVMDGMTFLSRLRTDKEQQGLPVIICTGKELTREERDRLQGQASGIVAKGDGFEENLKGILSKFFPLKGEGDGA
jgi:PAS domain S-box-containing protein